MKEKNVNETSENMVNDSDFNFKSLKIEKKKLSGKEADEFKDWMKYLFDRKEKGRLESYIKCCQRGFVKFARKEGNVVDIVKLTELATYVRHMADHTTPDGCYVVIPYDEIQRAFKKGPDGKWYSTGYSLAKYGIPDEDTEAEFLAEQKARGGVFAKSSR